MDFCSFSYFFPGLFRMFCWVLGAVLGISAVSATFSRVFSGSLAGFWVLFQGFLQFQLLFHRFFRMLGWVLGAVLGISAVSATFSQIFSGCWAGFWVLFQGFLRFQLLFLGFFPDVELSLDAVLEVLGITATKIALMKQHQQSNFTAHAPFQTKVLILHAPAQHFSFRMSDK